MADLRFTIKHTYNESEEEDYGTGYRLPGYMGSFRIDASSFEIVVSYLRERYEDQSNGEWYWEANDEGTRGNVWFENCIDGLKISFEVAA